MKYLKKFENSNEYPMGARKRVLQDRDNQFKSLKSDLKDICLELTDEGFSVEINDFNDDYMKDYFPGVLIKILINRHRFASVTFINNRPNISKNFLFNFSQISDAVERIIDYSDSCGYPIEIKYCGDIHNWEDITLEELYKLKSGIFDLSIKLKKIYQNENRTISYK